MNTIDREILPKTPVEEFFNKTVGPSATPEQKINAVKELLEHVLEQIMVSERELHLKQSKNNKGNGYYNRNLTAGSWNLNLDVPRDRNNEFRPLILPEKYKRTDASYVNLLMSLIVNGYSESQLHLSLKQLGLPYSDSDINFIKNQLIERLNDFKQKELPSN
ncbi:MAG: transposase, partial [Candidatus Goldbacteria bacterium]|nr:transposase [Candidatus Goldiibacteriota bacterium]